MYDYTMIAVVCGTLMCLISFAAGVVGAHEFENQAERRRQKRRKAGSVTLYGRKDIFR